MKSPILFVLNAKNMNNHPVISTSNNDERYMQLAIAEARKAYAMGEVPVGCIIVADEQIVGRGHNLTETLADVTAHAEMQAITAAAKGFLYIMTCPGGTKEQLQDMVAQIRKYTNLPCAVCISAEDAPYMMDTAALCDGIIEDTSIMELMKKRGSKAAPYIGAYIRSRKAMLKAL